MEPFDALQTPLDRLSLIEAGAGTGKTYTITSLYLRLILEAQRSVDQILVVTYTKAATAELRDRIRHRLSKAREAFLNGQDQHQDKFHDILLKRVRDHPWAIRRLTGAMHGLDEAAVFTIHGFCQRVLADHAFESAMPFETEVLADEGAILREIVEDFWRRTFYEASPLFTDYALAKGFWPDKLYAMVRPLIGKPYLEIPRYHSTTDFTDLEQGVCEIYEKVQNAWQSSHQAVAECLINNKSLNGNKYRQASIPLWLMAMDEYLSSPRTPAGLFDKFEKFTSRYLAKSVKKGAQPPEHGFFAICDELKTVAEELAASYDRALDAPRCELIDYANRELAQRKQHQQLQSYNDLLINLQRALQEGQGKRLAEAVRRQYSAALIDEFQDTDPIQYSIFRQLYIGSGLPVFFVGDPKQAIYSFRGADIFEYIKGRGDAQQQYTLDTNWRSVPDLLGAVNTLFGYTVNPFFFKEIVFHNALSAPSKRASLKIKGAQAAPFHIWFMGSDEAGKPVNKGLASEKSAQATAGEIARLLNLGSQDEASISYACFVRCWWRRVYINGCWSYRKENGG
jgi:exodeoxyribonuclease V beta subunit